MGFFFLSSFLNLPWLVGLRHRIPARAGEGICSSCVLQAQNQILFMEFNPLCWLAGLECLANGEGMNAEGEGRVSSRGKAQE